jgi:hypothetical protein
MQKRLFQTRQKPLVIRAEHVTQQHAHRLRALGGKVRYVGGDQLPGDVGGVLLGQVMHAFDHHVVREDQRFSAELNHRAIIVETSRPGVRRDPAQGVDEGEFAGQERTAFAMASSTPLTNFASRCSKKAWATSTYSLITVPVATSARAINS